MQTVTNILASLTLLSDLAVIIVILTAIFVKIRHDNKIFKSRLFLYIRKYALYLALIVSLTATLGSLYYSEIANLTPCKLCWYQRILMYPQALILLLAILKKDKKIADYLIVLSVIGAAVASYHYYLQRGGLSFIPCSTVGYSVDCAKVFTMSYGYITIPMMALTAFLLIIILMLISKINPQK